jgi:hypothetical protein
MNEGPDFCESYARRYSVRARPLITAVWEPAWVTERLHPVESAAGNLRTIDFR